MVQLADRMRWTLDYVESLDVQTFDRVCIFVEAMDKAREHVRGRAARKQAAKRGKR